jgi:hypothetical protein
MTQETRFEVKITQKSSLCSQFLEFLKKKIELYLKFEKNKSSLS